VPVPVREPLLLPAARGVAVIGDVTARTPPLPRSDGSRDGYDQKKQVTHVGKWQRKEQRSRYTPYAMEYVELDHQCSMWDSLAQWLDLDPSIQYTHRYEPSYSTLGGERCHMV
jgi:hypothetical protein